MRQKLTVGALVAFVALDVVLATAAVRHAHAPVGVPSSAVAPSGQVGPATRGTSAPAAPSPVAASPSLAAQQPATDPVYLAAGTTGGLIRATRGSCADRETPRVELAPSVAGKLRARAPREATEVLRVQAEGASTFWLVGLDQACKPGLFRTEDGGASWSRLSAAAAWYLPADPAAKAVFSPKGRRKVPCAPTSLSTVDVGVIRLLCDDGRLLGTADMGATWVPLGHLDGAVAIRYVSPSDGFALAARDNCPAAVLATGDGGTSWKRVSCLGDGAPQAVAGDRDLLVAQVGGMLKVSTDRGKSWRDGA